MTREQILARLAWLEEMLKALQPPKPPERKH